jgi:glycosyltransferase involved in cell wall biosynthesis
MKIALVAHGRFHAFDLAKALIRSGHDVTVYTNYPVWATRKFGLPDRIVRGFWPHGVLNRVLYKFSNSGLRWDTSGFLNPVFGRWVAAQIARRSYDVIHSFSGIAVELLEHRAYDPANHRAAHLVVRGSAHIEVQDALLHEEELRSHQRIERPCRTVIEREKREYQLADRIVTLSTFAYRSFLDNGIPKEKVALLPLGVDVSAFRATEEALEARCRRLGSGAPLRVLWVGTMSLQKGLLDYLEIVRALAGPNFQFRFVGDTPQNTKSLVSQVAHLLEFVPRQRQWNLRQQYEWGDVFVFPTIQDGFAAVLAQANANGLPILTTTNCAGPDMIQENAAGWVLPIRSPEAFVERLRWCDRNRGAVVEMVRRIRGEFVPRTWDNVARDFERVCTDAIQSLNGAGAAGAYGSAGAKVGS